MDKHTQNVISILKKENEYYCDLIELAKKKREVIINGKVDELDKIVKLEQNMIFNIGQLEQAREQEVTKLCSAYNISTGSVTLTEMIEKLQPEVKETVRVVQRKMTATLEELRTLNNINGELIQQSLEYIDFSVNLISSADSTTASLYDDLDKKEVKKEISKRMFDTKI